MGSDASTSAGEQHLQNMQIPGLTATISDEMSPPVVCGRSDTAANVLSSAVLSATAPKGGKGIKRRGG